MKKALSILLAAIMTASAAPLTYAKADGTEEALKTVKDRIEVPAELEDFESHSREEDGITVYDFSWSSDDGELNVQYLDEGIITSYYFYESKERADREPSFPKTDKEQMLGKAQDFIDKINPGAELTAEPTADTIHSGNTSFDIVRKHDGIEVENNTGHITFDNDNESVRNFYISWTSVKDFEPSDKAITADEAKKAFSDKLGFELVYNTYYDNDEIKAYPAYIEKNSGKYINAVTGEVFEPTYSWLMYSGGGSRDAAAAEKANSQSFTPQEQAELDKIAGLISKTDAEKKIRANKLISIPSDFALKGISLNRDYYDKEAYTYNITFSNNSQEDYKGIYVTMDAKTGDIYSINTSYRDAEKDADENTAVNALKTFTPSISEKYKYENGMLSRYENGVRVNGDNAYASVDKNGKLVSFHVNYTHLNDFPSVEKALGADEAAEKIFEYAGYKLMYFPQNDDKKAYLAYAFEKDVNLHALTGKHVSYNGEEVKENKYSYTDLDGHYAKEKIEKLAKFGIGFDTEQFRPDDKITVKDFKELTSSVFYSIRPLRNEKIGGENDETATVTRENAAIMLIEAMGAGNYAKYNDIYVQPFADVTENKGYIGILAAMGVLSGDENGNFNPKRELTRAEAAIVIYNYLSR